MDQPPLDEPEFEQKLSNALKVLKSRPGWQSADSCAHVLARLVASTRGRTPEQRIISAFDETARCYVDLVEDTETLDAYLLLLRGYQRAAAGHIIDTRHREDATADGQSFETQLEACADTWRKKAFARVGQKFLELPLERKVIGATRSKHEIPGTRLSDVLADMARFFDNFVRAVNTQVSPRPEMGSQVRHQQVGAGHSSEPTNAKSGKQKRLSPSIHSPNAARRMEAFLEAKGIGQTEFATRVGTTDRTLRSFRQTGKIRRDLFDNIAKQMNITRDDLLKSKG